MLGTTPALRPWLCTEVRAPLCRRSADIYEFSTETLFFGRQDAMQRLSLLPLAEHVRAAAQEGRDVRSMKLLEVAAGTGRFHTFIKVGRSPQAAPTSSR